MLPLFPDFPWWGLVLLYVASLHITGIAVSVYLHRHQTHRAIQDMHPWLAFFFRFWVWMVSSMVTKEWVAVHRKHHANVETAEDPHSPVVMGLPTVLFTGAVIYSRAVRDRAMVEKYGAGTVDDWFERNVFSSQRWVGILGLLGVMALLFGWGGVIWWAFQMLMVPLFAAGIINGIGHAWGYRNYDSPDHAKNIVPIGLFIAGEELHNNHHMYQRSAKFAHKWWEFDVSWVYIRAFEMLGLVGRVTRPTDPEALTVKPSAPAV